MRAGRLKFLKILFWCAAVKLVKKPASALDWFHQYTLGKLQAAMVLSERS